MVKTNPKSRIVQFHNDSEFGKNLLCSQKRNNKIVLQIEPINTKDYNFIAEIINEEDYEDYLHIK